MLNSLAAPAVDFPAIDFAALRAREFRRLDLRGEAYLDYGGSALYGMSQLDAHRRLLEDGLFGNPHSESGPSRLSTAVLEAARRRVLRHFDAPQDDYVVCFCANASAAIKLVGESYPFSRRRALVLTADNHNSVQGVREYARRSAAPVHYVALDRDLRLDHAEEVLDGARRELGGGLFAFPAQSNFSGLRHPLELVAAARRMGFDVLLDAAAYVPSSPLSLRHVPADFVALSFYKMFGFPTGLGALLARREALGRLHRPWFAGGTVTFASVRDDTHELRPAAEGFEDGTPNFLDVLALDAGFDLLDEIGMERIHRRVVELASRARAGLGALRHACGVPLVRLYGPSGGPGPAEESGTLAFNVLDVRGSVVPFADVETRARAARVALRGGCFCNPGAAEAAFGSAGEGSDEATGAVRLSLGLASNEADIDRALDVIASFRETPRACSR